MDALFGTVNGFFGLLDHLISAIEFLAVGTVCSLIGISVLPHDNPLRQTLQALCQRLMMTLGAAVIAVPVELIPGADVLYDIGAPLVLGWVCFTFFRDVLRSTSPPVPPSQTQTHTPSTSPVEAVRDFFRSHAPHSGKPPAPPPWRQADAPDASLFKAPPPRMHDVDSP
jgi:hypothetical protein